MRKNYHLLITSHPQEMRKNQSNKKINKLKKPKAFQAFFFFDRKRQRDILIEKRSTREG